MVVDAVIDILENIKNHLDFAMSLLNILGYGSHRNFCRKVIGEMKLPGGNTAERNAFEPVRVRQLQAGAIAGGKLLLICSGDTPANDGTDRMQNIPAREVKGRRNLGISGLLLMPLLIHQIGTGGAELNPGKAVDGVCYAYLNHTFHPHFPEKNHHSPLLSSPL